MNVKLLLASIILCTLVCFSCKKSSTSTSVTPSATTIANIDSLTGSYAGSTRVDSLYSYTDSAGISHSWLNSFGVADTFKITSSDTTNITVASKLYSLKFSYGDSLTLYSVTNLQNENLNENSYVTYKATLSDTSAGINHIVVNIWYGYNKHYFSSFYLYSR